MMQQATTSLPVIALLIFGGVPDTTGSDFSYAEVDAGLFNLSRTSESHSQTDLWDDSLGYLDDDEISIRYEHLARLAARRTKYSFVEGLPANWGEKRPRIDSAYLERTVEEEGS